MLNEFAVKVHWLLQTVSIEENICVVYCTGRWCCEIFSYTRWHHTCAWSWNAPGQSSVIKQLPFLLEHHLRQTTSHYRICFHEIQCCGNYI